MTYFASKGLFIRGISNDRYVVEDVFGNCSLPFESTLQELDKKTEKIANTRRLINVDSANEYPDYSDFRWDDLEYYFVAHIGYSLHSHLMDEHERKKYELAAPLMPTAYLDWGYGDGFKSSLESIHKKFKSLASTPNFPITEETMQFFLVSNQARRICSEIMSTLHRSIRAYVDLLHFHRLCIGKESKAIEQLGSNEIIHQGNHSYRASTAISSLAISLCTSLDLVTKLVFYLNSVDRENISYKPPKGKIFKELAGIKSGALPQKALNKINQIYENVSDLAALIQFRHDVIHSTSSIELERLYIGRETPEVNEMHLHYGCQFWRDCGENGQPIRYLGRSYFTESQTDIDIKCLQWLQAVIAAHISVGKALHGFYQNSPKA